MIQFYIYLPQTNHLEVYLILHRQNLDSAQSLQLLKNDLVNKFCASKIRR